MYEYVENIPTICPDLTHFKIYIKHERYHFKLFSFFESLSILPLKDVTFIIDRYHSTMTTEDCSSLQKIFKIFSLRVVRLHLDAYRPTRKVVYESFMASANNHYNKISLVYEYIAISNFQLASNNKKYVNSRYNRKYCHKIRVKSIPDFCISDFITKFKRTPGRYFDISGASNEKWNQMKEECYQFAKERPGYRFRFRCLPECFEYGYHIISYDDELLNIIESVDFNF